MPDSAADHAARVQAYFTARVADYDRFYDSPARLPRLFNRIFRRAVYLRRDFALRCAQEHGCTTLLDVGCGSGRNAVYFARHGLAQVDGLDFSAEMTAAARRLARAAGVQDRCRFVTADFMTWAPQRRYDIVVACGVFDYVPHAAALLARMAGCAARVVYGSFPGWTLVRSPLRKLRYALRGCPTHFYRRRELERLFRELAFGPTELLPVPSGHLAWAVRR